MPTKHIVLQGENLSKIATANGFRSWKSIYDAKENAEFRKKRPNPNLIKAGDEIVIPDKKPKSLPAKGPFELKKPEPQQAEIEIGFVFAEEPTEPMSGLEVRVALPPDGAKTKDLVTSNRGIISMKAPDLVEGVVRILTIRDPAEDPPKNYDKFGQGDFATGHSHLVALPEDPIQASLPIALYRSTRRPKLNTDNTPAADILSGDYTQGQIEDIRILFLADRMGSATDTELFTTFQGMATDLFSTGKLEGNIIRMIQRFRDNTGAEYSDPELTEAVRAHHETKRYEENIRKELKRLIDQKKGDVNQIGPNELDPGKRPIFGDAADVKDGLTVAINDTWSQDVDLTEYRISRKKYQGKFRITLYDHFGLDRPDVEKKFGLLAGFRAWFILQHLPRFAFKPFVTKMEMDYEFDGTVGK